MHKYMYFIGDDNVIYVGHQMFEGQDEFSNHINKNNTTMVKIPNANGDIYITNGDTLLINQIIEANKYKLIKRNEFVDYQFLKFEFIPRLRKLLKEWRIETEFETGQMSLNTDYIIVQNDIIFQVSCAGAVYVNQTFHSNSDTLLNFLSASYSKREVRDENYMKELFKYYEKYMNDDGRYYYFFNSKDKKVKLVRLKEEI